MTSFEHLKAKLEHAQSIDANAVRVDIEELASVLDELQELRNAKKNCKECYSRCLDCDKRLKAYNEGKADAIDEFVDFYDKKAVCADRLNGECIHLDDECSCIQCIAEQLKEKNNED